MPEAQYSSFQIAKLLHVSRQAVNQWIDKGYMTSYRTPGGHRRVMYGELVRFLESRDIPLPKELTPEPKSVRATDAPLIYLLDDDPDYLTLLGQAIGDALPKAQIEKFANGVEMLMAVGRRPPSLLVLDLMMPEMDGVEVCRRLKASEVGGEVPIVVLTAFPESESTEPLQELDVVDVLPKGEPLEDLVRRIAAQIGQGEPSST